jgi:hypothetical protein
MRTTFSLLFVGLMAACTPPDTTPPTHPEPPVLYLLLNDVTGSAGHLDLPPEELVKMILADSLRESIHLAGIRIDDKSSRQTPFVSPTLRTDLHRLTGRETIYEKARIERHNAGQRQAFESSARQATDSLLTHLQHPRTAPDTDLNGALRLAQKLARQPGFSRHEIRIVAISDLLHDFPADPNPASFPFPDNATIFLIGASDNARPDLLFPENKVIELAAFRAEFFQQ